MRKIVHGRKRLFPLVLSAVIAGGILSGNGFEAEAAAFPDIHTSFSRPLEYAKNGIHRIWNRILSVIRRINDWMLMRFGFNIVTVIRKAENAIIWTLQFFIQLVQRIIAFFAPG